MLLLLNLQRQLLLVPVSYYVNGSDKGVLLTVSSLLLSGGLAIARPSAIAIAGVSPEDVSNLGIPIPQKKIIKKNYSGLASRTLASSASSLSASAGAAVLSDDVGKYRSTMLQTPYGDIKILIGPDYKKPVEMATTIDQDQPKPTTMDYSKDLFNSKPDSLSEDGEILAEDFQEAEDAMKYMMGSQVPARYDELMAVAPLDNILNRYPLAPPKFTGYSAPSSSRSNFNNKQQAAMQAAAPVGYNPALAAALYYQNYQNYQNALPVNAPYNYPYSSLPFPAPMYFGY